MALTSITTGMEKGPEAIQANFTDLDTSRNLAITSGGDWISTGTSVVNGFTGTLYYRQEKIGNSGLSKYYVKADLVIPQNTIKQLSNTIFAYLPATIVPSTNDFVGQVAMIASGNYIVAIGQIAMGSGATGEYIMFQANNSISGMGFVDPVPNGELRVAFEFTGNSI